MHKNQKSILAAIKKNPEITVRELQRVCKISSSSVVQHHLLVLQADGIIRKVNKWEILEKEKIDGKYILKPGDKSDGE